MIKKMRKALHELTEDTDSDLTHDTVFEMVPSETFRKRSHTVSNCSGLARQSSLQGRASQSRMASSSALPSSESTPTRVGSLRRAISSVSSGISSLFLEEQAEEISPDAESYNDESDSRKLRKGAELRKEYSLENKLRKRYLLCVTISHEPDAAQLTVTLESGTKFLEDMFSRFRKESLRFKLIMSSNGRRVRKKMSLSNNGILIRLQTAIFENVPRATLSDVTLTLRLASKGIFLKTTIREQHFQAKHLLSHDVMRCHWETPDRHGATQSE